MRYGGAGNRRWLLTGGSGGGLGPSIAAIGESCLARAGVVCQACADACPERAIRFPLRRGGPLPAVEQDRCTGCNACAPVCPVGAIELIEGRT
jgi:Fe-S-cluster-containing hydrogenase component 2